MQKPKCKEDASQFQRGIIKADGSCISLPCTVNKDIFHNITLIFFQHFHSIISLFLLLSISPVWFPSLLIFCFCFSSLLFFFNSVFSSEGKCGFYKLPIITFNKRFYTNINFIKSRCTPNCVRPVIISDLKQSNKLML